MIEFKMRGREYPSFMWKVQPVVVAEHSFPLKSFQRYELAVDLILAIVAADFCFGNHNSQFSIFCVIYKDI